MAGERIILRMCVSCREMRDRRTLIKVVKSAEGNVSLDKSGKLPGRGAYICKNEECIASAGRKRCFERAFKQNVPPEIYEALRNELNE